MLRFTIAVTQACNLRCSYCYVAKHATRMGNDVARRAVDLLFSLPADGERPRVGFFGGEPLLETSLVVRIATDIRERSVAVGRPVDMSVVTNGTIFTSDVVRLVHDNDVAFCVSCDGPAAVQDRHRLDARGFRTSSRVDRTIRAAVAEFGFVPVNAVYTPETCALLPQVVEYLSSLGVRSIYLNPDLTSAWEASDVETVRAAFARIGEWYVEQYRHGTPHFIAALDNKIAVLLRGGYQPLERCHMGRLEIAVSPAGYLYPCDRLIGDGLGGAHSIGNVWDGLDPGALSRCPSADAPPRNPECFACGLAPYCMNWCRASNYLATGDYERVSPFLCALERALIQTASSIIPPLLDQGQAVLAHHVAGAASTNSQFGLS